MGSYIVPDPMGGNSKPLCNLIGGDKPVSRSGRAYIPNLKKLSCKKILYVIKKEERFLWDPQTFW